MKLQLARTLTWLALICVATPTWSDELELSFGDDVVRGGYARTWEGTRLDGNLSWLHHRDDGDVLTAGLLAVGFIGQKSREVELALGGEMVFVDAFRDSGGAIAFGGRARYPWPRLQRLTLEGSLFYAPEFTTLSSVEEYSAVRAGVSFRLFRQASILASFERVRVDLDSTSRDTVDSSAHLGLRVRFR